RPRFPADDRMPVVLDAIDILPAAVVVPVVSGEAMLGAVGAGEEGRMTHRREGGRMKIMGVDGETAVVHQVAEAALAETVGKAQGDIAAQPVDGDGEDELRMLRGSCLRNPGGRGEYGEQGSCG